jgi:hypothetical protein
VGGVLVALVFAAVAGAWAASWAPAASAPSETPSDKVSADSTEVTVDASTAGKASAWAACPGPGKHITCLLATEKTLYAGTEDTGLWKCDLAADPTQAASWQQMSGVDGPGNDIYGLAQDTDGRLWAGTQNRGVSVWNGKAWKAYGVIDGCIGERVFWIAADPGFAKASAAKTFATASASAKATADTSTDKPDSGRAAVWIATDHGLTSWTPDPPDKPEIRDPKSETRSGSPAAAAPPAASLQSPAVPVGTLSRSTASDPSINRIRGIVDPKFAQGTWRSFTKADGLPSSQIYAVAVDSKGRVFVGTECDGLAYADPPYNKWQSVRAAAELSGDQPGMLGRAFVGSLPGLPSNLTNSLLVLHDGTVVYGTCYGLGISHDRGAAWSSWQGIGKEACESYIRGLAADKSGGLWIATERKGAVWLNLKTGALKSFTKPAIPEDYVFDVAVAPDGTVFAGTYAGGLVRATPTSAKPADVPPATSSAKALAAEASAKAGQSSPPLLPSPAAPPTLDELNAMLAALSKVPFVNPNKQPAVVRLDDDWLTKGECLGRYGRYWGCWCAAVSPRDYIWGAGPEKVSYSPRLGANCRLGDALRYWMHWLQTTNPNSLELPPTYMHSRVVKGYATWDRNRRQAEWDDHGETYPASREGPSVYCTMTIPAGLYRLSLYNFNKDGHVGWNRFRDFTLSIRSHSPKQKLWDINGFQKLPELARGRIRDFWGSTYKRFLVRGPTEITFEVDRNHSYCTILAGVFLDLVDEEPVPYFHDLNEWKGLEEQREKDREALRTMPPAERAACFQPGQKEPEAASRLFAELEKTRLSNAVWWATESRRLYAPILRWTQAAQKTEPAGPEKPRLLARATTCCYELDLYDNWEAGQVLLGKVPARQIEKALRWDGKMPSCQGKGYQLITEYLAEKRQKSQMVSSIP